MLGCSPAVTNDAPVNSKLTDMIASGVYFARDLVGECMIYQTTVATTSLTYSFFPAVYLHARNMCRM